MEPPSENGHSPDAGGICEGSRHIYLSSLLSLCLSSFGGFLPLISGQLACQNSFQIVARRRGATGECEARTQGAAIAALLGRLRTTHRAARRVPAAQSLFLERLLSWTRAISWARRSTLTATPPSLTSKPASFGKSTLSPGSMPCASSPTAVTTPNRASAPALCGMIRPVAGLDVLVDRLDDQMVVERLERQADVGFFLLFFFFFFFSSGGRGTAGGAGHRAWRQGALPEGRGLRRQARRRRRQGAAPRPADCARPRLGTRSRMSDCAAGTRRAARCVVLSRPSNAAIAAPCVLASHSPVAPRRRASI